MATTRSWPGGLRSPPAGAGRRAPDEQVEHTVTGSTASLAPCLQDAAPPAGSRCQRRAWSALRAGKRTVKELLPLVGKGRATPLAVFRVRPGSAYGRRPPELS